MQTGTGCPRTGPTDKHDHHGYGFFNLPEPPTGPLEDRMCTLVVLSAFEFALVNFVPIKQTSAPWLRVNRVDIQPQVKAFIPASCPGGSVKCPDITN